MQVRLNCWRGENNPGDIVDLDDADAAALLAHGGAVAVDGPEAVGRPGRVVKGEAVLESASGAGDASP